MRKLLLAVLILCPGWTALAQTANTTVTGTVVNPNGTHPSGTITLKEQRIQNDANPRQYIGPSTTVVPVTNGAFSVSLFPNTASLPSGTCFSAAYALAGSNFTRYWTVPVSSTPVNVQLIEGNIPCGQQAASSVAPGQIVPGAPGVTQVLTSSPTGFVSWGAGGSGGNQPGGNNGQIQYNNNGNFGGFSMAGDCSMSIPNILCTKTNGVPFAPSATTDTTNAANITSGLLLPARGGTGAGQFAQGSVPFIGVGGVYQQDNPNFSWDSTTKTFRANNIITAATGTTPAIISTSAAQSFLKFLTTGATSRGYIGYSTSGSGGLAFLDSTGVIVNLSVSDVGNVSVGSIGKATSTTLILQPGSGQGSTSQMVVNDATGTQIAAINAIGDFLSPDFLTTDNGSKFNGSGLVMKSGGLVGWTSSGDYLGPVDTGLSRISAGVLSIGTGAPGSFAGSLKLTNITTSDMALTGSGFTGGGTVNICVDNSGNLTTAGCPGGGGGGGTVTNTGPLTAGHLILGNSGVNVIALGSLGTTTTLLHGNAGGNPSFAAVSLTADVTGILPFANGGLGTGSNFTNHFFYGNNSGGTAAPIAVQPTWADLAAGAALTRATFPGGDLFIGGVNTQTGTTYAMLTSDENKITTFNNGSAVAVSLSQATTTGFTAGAVFHIYNIGAGAVTVTPTTSTINGSSTAVLNQGQGAIIVSDGTDYSAWISAAPSGSGTVTSVATTGPIGGGTITSTGTITCTTCVTSAAALTSNQLVIGGGLQASAALGSLGTTTTVLHGNNAGAPSFAAITLTTDVTGLLPLANGGLAANITASNGGIFYSTGAAGSLLAGTATARQMLQSGASTTPAWSTTTWPATTTINRILYSSSTSVIGEITTANGGILNAGATGIPTMTVTPVLGVAGTSAGTIGLSGITSGVVTIQPASAAGTWSLTLPTTGGTNGYFLQTNGSGVTTWASTTSGTVTVVGAGTLTSTALVTGGGSQAIQTPFATATLDTSGNLAVTSIATGTAPPTLTPGTGAAEACVEGTAPSVGPASGVDVTYCDSALHAILDSLNNGSYYPRTHTIASGSTALGTSSIAPNACATVVTASATGGATTDKIVFTPNADWSAITGYGAQTTDTLKIYPYVTANTVNFKVCNQGASSITPGAATLNWGLMR